MRIFNHAIMAVLLTGGVAGAQDTDTRWRLTLAGADEPGSSAQWKRPASISYIASGAGEDRDEHFDLNLHGEAAYRLGAGNTQNLRTSFTWHRSTEEGSEEDSSKLSIGWADSWWDTDDGEVFVSAGLSAARVGVFTDGSAAGCDTDPTLPQCDTQYTQSYRLTASAAPWNSRMNLMPGWPSERTQLLLLPSVTAFHDDVFDNAVNPATGEIITGSVSGIQSRMRFELRDRNFENRWIAVVEGSFVNRLSADTAREAAFDETAQVLTASFDVAIGGRALDAKGVFVPIIGVEFRDGTDPLRGRRWDDYVSFGFRLRYVPG